MMPKLKLSSWRWLILTLWWCILIGLIVPQTPSWGLPIVIALAMLMVILLSVLLFKQTQQTIRRAIDKIYKILKINSMSSNMPSTIITVSCVSSVVVPLSRNIPSNILEFTLLAVSSVWGWLEIATRTGIKLQPSFSTFHSIVFILGLSIVGIAIGSSIHLSLNG
ncbi:MAG: hypothetical protein QNJ63_01805 [Calothrix sp. MO_192.B10]|nr:hypothetical protein [Calothrix sp. MO_192.B10]